MPLSSPRQPQPPVSPLSQRSQASPHLLSAASIPANDPTCPSAAQNPRGTETRPPPPPTGTSSTSADILQLQDHVRQLEQKLLQRDHELQRLQFEIEKGTSSIMSSIEDLYLVSSGALPTRSSPSHPTIANAAKQPPTIEQLQNEIDQLHDKLDELSRENQTLKNRTQEFDTIYEENEYLYEEKSQWNEELERARVRESVLEQEISALKEREKESLGRNEPDLNKSNPTQLKLNIDWLSRTNNQLELEIVRLREQLDSMTRKWRETKEESTRKDEHYQQLLSVAEDEQRLPQVS